MGAIFISYRRSDSEGQASLLFRDLSDAFGNDRTLIDVVGMVKGRDFRKTIEQRLNESSVFLAVIGRSWLTATDGDGRRRLDDPSDLVRLETVSALRSGLPVIPVLVGGAKMPGEHDLPTELQEIVYRDGVELTHARWNYDVRALVDSLQPLMRQAETDSKRQPKYGFWMTIGSVTVAAAAGVSVVVDRFWPHPDDAQLQRAAAEGAAAEKSATERAATDKAATDKAVAEEAAKSATRKIAAEKLVAEKAIRDRAEAARVADERAVAERREAELLGPTLNLAGRATLGDIARKVAGVSLHSIEVEGYTDSTLSRDLSLRVAAARAEIVKDYLVQLGIHSSKITTIARGASKLGDDRTAEGRAKNNYAFVVVSWTLPGSEIRSGIGSSVFF